MRLILVKSTQVETLRQCFRRGLRPHVRARLLLNAVRSIACVSALVISATKLVGEEANEGDSTDKTVYNLFNPTPREVMRELATDRPDKTESPYTVDAGHFQLEMDFVTFTRDRSDGIRTETWNAVPVNLKIGMLNNVDLQFVFDSYLQVHATSTQSGIGDLATRLKINLWGDDNGRTALAILPYLKFPTDTGHVSNDAIEGGLIVPLAVKLPAEFDLGLETAFNFLRNGENAGHHTEFFNSVTCSHAIAGKLEGYLEFFSSVSTERHSSWVGTVDAGFTYALAQNIQLDCGGNFGVTAAADDMEFFTGMTVRF